MDDKEEVTDSTVSIEPLEVRIVKEKEVKEYDNLEHEDEEYEDIRITKEQIKEFEENDSS